MSASDRKTDLKTDLRTISSEIDARDVAILRALLEHKVLTTHQIHVLFFRSRRRCQHRLSELKNERLLSSFEPRRDFGQGRSPEHHFLTEHGVSILARKMGVAHGDLPWVPDAGYEDNRNLRHRMGVNAFFCALAEASRAVEGHCLHRWAPERKVRTRAGEIQPDGFGRYLHPGGACEFYLEYDRGTEGPAALAGKLRSYLRFAAALGEGAPFPNVFVVVPNPSREGDVGEGLATVRRKPEAKADLPLFVTSEELLNGRGVLGAVWLAMDEEGERLALPDLPAVDAAPYDRGRCLGRSWTDPGARSRISARSETPRFPIGSPRRSR
ncbi:MAG TPA: replication-relaxation family protein [Actinomycetota bacterium]|nr:replication-relaxation family protein [Actinomycetota bacterium]